MTFLKKYGFYIMILAVISELTMPLVLKNFYPGYNQMTMLISSFGENGSPTKVAFKIWAIADGFLFLLTIPSFYSRFKATSQPLAKWLGIAIAVFGIGDCIITGVFDRSSQAVEFNIESAIHDYASGLGFVALLVGTLILIRLYYLEKNPFMVTVLPLIFIISALFMLLFSAPRIPVIDRVHIPYRGLWQRGNLLFLYLPFFIVSVTGIRRSFKKEEKEQT